MEVIYAIKTWLVWGAVVASVLMFFVALLWESVRDAYVRAHPWARGVFFVAVAGITLYGGSKHITGKVSYPFTDPEVRYLTDAGSFVTNGYVHIAFNRNILVPTSANIFIDRCEVQYTNETDIVEHTVNSFSNTFANLTVPFDHIFENATNYNWFVYTDWTPPPVVHTNGVAYVVWQIGSDKPTNVLVTTRTGIYMNTLRLAPNPAITNLPPIQPSTTTNTQEDEE